MRRKTIFGTLVILAMLLGTILAAAVPTSTGHEYYWIVHDDEEPDPYERPQLQEIEDNLGMFETYKSAGPFEEIWYTAFYDNARPYDGEIRPIRDESWHQNTWIHADVSTIGPDAILNCTIYSPNNENPEWIHYILTNGNHQDAYFKVTARDYDTQDIIEQFTIEVTASSEAQTEKLDSWLDQFTLELEYFKF